MDITQILITVGATVGIVVVAVLAIVPTLLEIPRPDEVAARHPKPRHLRPVSDTAATAAKPKSGWHLAA